MKHARPSFVTALPDASFTPSSVSCFPVVLSGDPIEYDGPRKADGIAEWLSRSKKLWCF